MEEQPTFSGFGSTCYIIPESDLEPDTLTPREGKQWAKVDVSKTYSIKAEDESKPFDVPIPADRNVFLTQSVLDGMMEAERRAADKRVEQLLKDWQHAPFDVFVTDDDGHIQHIGNVAPDDIHVRYVTPHVQQFRKHRLRVKFRKRLMRYLVRYEGREPFDTVERHIYLHDWCAPTSRHMMKVLNQKMKLGKRGKL